MTEHTMELAGGSGSIQYWLEGDGPPLVLVSTLSGTWQMQVRELRKRFTVLTYDMRGFGRSPSANGLPSNQQHADDLAALLTAVGCSRARLIGLSHGGLVCQHFAARYPDRLAGLVLAATFARARGSTRLFLRMLHGFLERDDVPHFWEVLKSFLFSEANADRILRREGLLRRAMFDQYDAACLRSIYGQAIEHDSSAWLGAVRCPTLVVGGAEDMLFPPPLSQELSALVAGSKLVLLPAAHVPPVEVPRQFNETIADFFGRAP